MLEWPGRCSDCRQPIDDWAEAGLFDRRWIHKDCWSQRFAVEQSRGAEPPALRSPIERSTQLELPMLIFLLLFHFGLGAAVAGWVMLDQGRDNGGVVLAIGLIVPLIGAVGVVLNIIGRRRIEAIRQALDAGGGWKPGR